jgi:hypothetical protein
MGLALVTFISILLEFTTDKIKLEAVTVFFKISPYTKPIIVDLKKGA